MHYGPTSKQLDKVKINLSPVDEFVDVDGFFADGKRDAIRGRILNTGYLKLKENIEAYKNGYYSIKKLK
jgi:hypothetical protein